MNDEKKGFNFKHNGTGYNNHFINQKILDLIGKYKKLISAILTTKRDYYMRDDNLCYILMIK